MKKLLMVLPTLGLISSVYAMDHSHKGHNMENHKGHNMESHKGHNMNGMSLSEVKEKNGVFATISSKKPLITGLNSLNVQLKDKNGNLITDAKVKIKVFMPEMPGMPYMEYKDKATLVDDTYKLDVNFSMGGTWQYHLKFKTSSGEVSTIRGSFNL